MAGDQKKKKNPLGPTGRTVAENVRRLRTARGLAYTELAAKLDEIDRPIPTLGLRNIENQKRRVDADDLMALAVALGVSPAALLLTRTAHVDDTIEITGVSTPPYAGRALSWLANSVPVLADQELVDFMTHSYPPWLMKQLTDAARNVVQEQRLYTDEDGVPHYGTAVFDEKTRRPDPDGDNQ